MDSFQDLFSELIIIEEEIELCYIELSKLENKNYLNTDEFHYYNYLLHQDIEKEKILISKMAFNGYTTRLWKHILVALKDEEEHTITIATHPKSIYFRLKNLLEILCGDDILYYVQTLKYDQYQIMMKFLSNMINNPNFSHIKSLLIDYKYNLIYLNCEVEDDYLNEKLDSEGRLNTRNYRTDIFRSYSYIDKAILVYDSKENIEYLLNHSKSLDDIEIHYGMIVIKIMQILSSLMLCEEDMLHYVRFLDLLRDDDIPQELKNIIEEMIQLLMTIKEEISWSR